MEINLTLLKTLTTPHPARDWYVVLGVVGLVSLPLVGVALYLIVGIQSGLIIVPRTDTLSSSPNISRDALTEVLDVYTARRVNYESKNFQVPDIDDPAR